MSSSLPRQQSEVSWLRLLAHLPEGVSQPPALANQLAEEMAACWQRGERPLTETFLDRQPELWQQPEAALPLIYEEICLRQEQGEEDAPARVMARFPQWHQQLSMLLDCHALLATSKDSITDGASLPPEPGVGDTLGAFRLHAELGRGGAGGVFLACEPALADRLMVLKVTPCTGQEHLSLARLQHTHIVPLYSVFEERERNLRVLCMPYFGGASLAHLLHLLNGIPVSRRMGSDVLDALDRVHAEIAVPRPGAQIPRTREAFSRMNYAQVITWMGACLADALHYAHERGLVHLDLKPANVLVAGDATPMLLDFHLAREPLQAGTTSPDWLGGTPLFMAPEQARAVQALSDQKPVSETVDGKADIYSLGLLLYIALGGKLPVDIDRPMSLARLNAQVSPGLADIIQRCLSRSPQQRYPGAGSLAEDLRRHLQDRPLRYVSNRSWTERWRKWRRRRPHALVVVATILALLASTLVVVWHVRQRAEQPRLALLRGQELLRQGQYQQAIQEFERGQELAASIPFTTRVRKQLDEGLDQARQKRMARKLHDLAEHLRLASVAHPLARGEAHRIEQVCRVIWEKRQQLARGWSQAIGNRNQVTRDFLDVVLIWTNLQIRQASEEQRPQIHRTAIRVLEETESLVGKHPALAYARDQHAWRSGLLPSPPVPPTPRTFREQVIQGRSLLEEGHIKQAQALFRQAAKRKPDAYWPHFYQGHCAYRLDHYEEAVTAFTVCIALAPSSPGSYHNRALAEQARGKPKAALADYTAALQRDPQLAGSWLNRGILHLQVGQLSEARSDLQQALKHGADQATAHYHLALVALANRHRAGARAHLQHTLQHNPSHPQAPSLLRQLTSEPSAR